MNGDFDKRYPHARASTREPYWPPNVRSISQDGLHYLGIDDDGRLYWDGRRLEMYQRFSLTKVQAGFAIAGVLAAMTVAAIELLRFFGYGAGAA